MSGRVREHVRTVVFMFVLTFVFISAVTAVHLAAAGRIARNATLYLKRAVLAAAGLTVPAGAAEVERLYAAGVRARPAAAGEAEVYDVTDAATDRRGIVVMRAGAGLWGRIRAAVGFDARAAAFTGAAFVQHSETPGLGARIDEPWFGRQFAGKRPPLELVPEKTRSADPHKVDAITGATITSSAVRDILNGAAADARAALETQGDRK